MAGRSDSRQGLDVSNHSKEQEDIAIAIAASLATPGSSSSGLHVKWIPQTAYDWQIYRRQLGIEEQAYDDLSSDKKSERARESGSLNQPPSKDFVSGSELVKGSGAQGSLNQRPSNGLIPPTQGPQGKFWASRPKAPPISPIEVESSNSESGNSIGEPESSKSQTLEPVHPTSEPVFPPRHTIEDCIKEMAHGHSDELPRIYDHDGDTWIFIDPAAQQPEQTDREYEIYFERYAKPIVVKSTTLKQLRSSFFDERLNASYQFRVIRRRGLRQSLPPQIKYVIDLTPPTEGDEAAWLMSELCCVDGVRNWSQSHTRWQVSNTLVGGRDEFTGSRSDEVPLPEICPIRHRACIERVLNGIRGFDPRLDSAVKVYTTFVVARFFNITHSTLTDYIIRWIRAPPNTLSIEALPEIALKIGDGLQCLELVRDSFAILVGEEALEMLRKTPDSGYTIYGRKKNDVPESYKTRIEYASKSFLDRALKAFEDLTEYNMRWMENLSVFKTLPSNVDESLEPVVNELKIALKAYVRGAILAILHSELLWAPSLQLGSAGVGDSLYPRMSRQEFSNSLDVKKRILTSTFWQALQEPRFYDSSKSPDKSSNLTVWRGKVGGCGARINKDDLTALVREHGVKEMPYVHLEALAERCRRGLLGAEKGSTTALEKQRDPRDPQIPLLHEPQSFDDMMWNSAADCLGSQFPQGDTKNTNTGSGTSDLELAICYRKSLNAPKAKEFHLPALTLEIDQFLKFSAQSMLFQQDTERLEPMEMNMTPILVGLDQAEWKYLPLYAGGLDDGSGGVFNDDVPSAQLGFSTAGPGVHTGSGSSAASSEFDFVEGKDLESTHHTSTAVNDGFSDQLDRRMVYDGDDELWDDVLAKKYNLGSIAASYTETGTMAAPSTIGPDSETVTMAAPSTTDGESEDGFILPLRNKGQDPASNAPVGHDQTPANQDGGGVTAEDQDDFGEVFMDSDDDTTTEKGDDDYCMCDDEDMVMV